jgi:hypothetical protein
MKVRLSGSTGSLIGCSPIPFGVMLLKAKLGSGAAVFSAIAASPGGTMIEIKKSSRSFVRAPFGFSWTVKSTSLVYISRHSVHFLRDNPLPNATRFSSITG